MQTDFNVRVCPDLGAGTSVDVSTKLATELFTAEKSDLLNTVSIRLNKNEVIGTFGLSQANLLFAGDIDALIKFIIGIGEARCKELNDALDLRIATVDLQLRTLSKEIESLKSHLTGDLHPEGADNAIKDSQYLNDLVLYGSKLRLHDRLTTELAKLIHPSSTWRVVPGKIVGTNLEIKAEV